MLKNFLEATQSLNPLIAVTSFELAGNLAKRANQTRFQAECMYRIAFIVIHKQLRSVMDACQLLISARELNSTGSFQEKVEDLLTIERRRSISSLLDMAMLVYQQDDLWEFIDGAQILVASLFERYPTHGINGNTVLDGDVGRGLLKVVRVFHPDKNASADGEGRWICEEVTKVRAVSSYRRTDLDFE